MMNEHESESPWSVAFSLESDKCIGKSITILNSLHVKLCNVLTIAGCASGRCRTTASASYVCIDDSC